MIAQERYKFILGKLESEEIVRVQKLAKQLQVSIETIRRDLEHLEREQLLKRVHGGAVPIKRKEKIENFQIREMEFLEEKKEIAKFVYDMIPGNKMIFMDSSTTNYEIAKLYKSGEKDGSIVTNSIIIAMELSELKNINTLLIGGKVDASEKSTYGASSIDILKNYYADYALISTSGIMEGIGITDHSLDMGEIQKMMLKNSNHKIIIADSSKFDSISNYKIASFDEISLIVTDSKIDNKKLERYGSLVTIIHK
ncbi:MAG: DeoR/GlpR family DNA-binding transcription regulator [Tissierellia bacterium]|nr:DeoR/GlpR family DNA-binding transcription regulator [Tissierellia bacterium]